MAQVVLVGITWLVSSCCHTAMFSIDRLALPRWACSRPFPIWVLEELKTLCSPIPRMVFYTGHSQSPGSSVVESAIVRPHIRFSDFCSNFPKVLGPRLTLFFGTMGYALYVGSLWWYAHSST